VERKEEKGKRKKKREMRNLKRGKRNEEFGWAGNLPTMQTAD